MDAIIATQRNAMAPASDESRNAALRDNIGALADERAILLSQGDKEGVAKMDAIIAPQREAKGREVTTIAEQINPVGNLHEAFRRIPAPENTDASAFQRAGTELATIISESDWKAGDRDYRRGKVEEMDRAIRNAYGLDDRSPEWVQEPGSYGRFFEDTERVGYTDLVLEDDDPAEAIKTVAHENRHAFQWEVIHDRKPEPEAGRSVDWSQAWRDYPTNHPDLWTKQEEQHYRSNPLEIDARVAENAIYTAYVEQLRKATGEDVR
jgi:hypothetical protein